ncbi:MAG TPA: polysaccharide biosynthesis/export family protein [Terriglobales bacterium]|jgi:polysaccharide biosynthesis/export protein|nr:polysaccharide biosynthesis/export family protein [Terriglobales bacterium]
MDVSRLSSLRAAIAVFAFVAAHGCGSLLQGQQTQTDVFPSATTSTQTTQAAGTGAWQEKQSTEPATKEASPKSEADTSVVELGPGDLIEISVYGVPELNTKTRITNNGDVYLPLIDYVHVADLNINEAQTLIQKRLDDGGFVRNPHVTIFVDESASQGATVLGEVVRPGIYPVLGDRRLYDLISAAGGFTDKAGRVVTITHRSKPDSQATVHLPPNLADQTDANVAVAPGDTIVIGRAGIVYVVGDVNRPSGFMIEDNNLTVLKALALAGGANKTASLNSAKLLRQGPNGVQEIPVQLKRILQAKSPDAQLLKGDILFIPGSAAKAFAYRGAEAAISMTTALAVVAYRP